MPDTAPVRLAVDQGPLGVPTDEVEVPAKGSRVLWIVLQTGKPPRFPGPDTKNYTATELGGGEHTVRLLLDVAPRGERDWSGALRSNELTFCVAGTAPVPVTRPAPWASRHWNRRPRRTYPHPPR